MKLLWVFAVYSSTLLFAEFPSSVAAAQDKKESKTGTDRSSPPSCKSCPSPQLPPGARNLDIGFPAVKLDMRISTEGDVEDIRVVSATGDDFADEAVKAVRKWKFKPARGKDGKPSPVRVTIEVKFNFVSGPPRRGKSSTLLLSENQLGHFA